MAKHLGRGDVTSPANPQLEAFILKDGVLFDPYSLSYEILDLTAVSPAQVVPPTAVDLVAERVSVGRFAPVWEVPSDASFGRHAVVWRLVLVDGERAMRWTETFDIVAHPELFTAGVDPIALLSDVRGQGARPSVTDAELFDVLALVSQNLRDWTGRPDFTPTAKTVDLDAPVHRTVLLQEVLIAASAVGYVPVGDAEFVAFDPAKYIVYNRHVLGAGQPDDRKNPKIELVRVGARRSSAAPGSMGWAFDEGTSPLLQRGRVRVSGVWGYTDRDGSPAGGTPVSARRAVVLMALTELPKQGSDAAQEARDRHLVNRMRTREQEIGWQRPTAATSAYEGFARWTGDPKIDVLIEGLVAPLGGATL